MEYAAGGVQQPMYFAVPDRAQIGGNGGGGGGMGQGGYFTGSHVPWLACIAITVGAILLVGVLTLVLSGILVHWQKDSHYTLGGGCDDGDPCTKDLELEGGCTYLPRPDGHSCNSACFYPEPADSLFDGHRCLYDQVDEFGKWNPKSVCTGTECKGQCTLTSDCPDITFADGINGDSTKDCDSGACYYTLDVTDLNNDIDVPCDRNSDAYAQVCVKKLNASDPIIEDNCLATESVCDPDPGNALSTDLVLCQYFFRCACPIDNFVMVRNAPEEPGLQEKEERDAGTEAAPAQEEGSSYEGLSQLLEDIQPKGSPQGATIKGRAKLWQKR